jgi:hypothetical protein
MPEGKGEMAGVPVRIEKDKLVVGDIYKGLLRKGFDNKVVDN